MSRLMSWTTAIAQLLYIATPVAPFYGLAIGTILIFSINPQCSAAPIASINPSFESPDTLDGTKSNVLTGWSNFHGSFMQQGVFDPDNTSYSNASGNLASLPGTATGYQVCFLTGVDQRIRQNVGAV